MPPTEQDTNVALLAYKRSHGNDHHAMRCLLQSVAGVSAMSHVPPERREAVIAACESGEIFDGELRPKKQPRTLESISARAWKNWNGARRE